MSAEEAAAMLAAGRKLQLATINPDGTVHLVTMYYAMLRGQIAFWTYRRSQKARNLARDPRLTCLVESGREYFDLRGVQVTGVARCLTDPGEVLEIGRLIAASMGDARVAEDALESYVASAAKKRYGYLVEPTRVITWDHSKLV
jgi:PPOX class probable F420-dependent enzyme